MRTVNCDDCGAKIKSLGKVNGEEAMFGLNSGVNGITLIVPVYVEGDMAIRFKKIDCCLECLKKRGHQEKHNA